MLSFLIYMAGFLFFAYTFTGLLYRTMAAEFKYVKPDAVDLFMAILLGSVMAIFWPLTGFIWVVSKVATKWLAVYGIKPKDWADQKFLGKD